MPTKSINVDGNLWDLCGEIIDRIRPNFRSKIFNTLVGAIALGTIRPLPDESVELPGFGRILPSGELHWVDDSVAPSSEEIEDLRFQLQQTQAQLAEYRSNSALLTNNSPAPASTSTVINLTGEVNNVDTAEQLRLTRLCQTQQTVIEELQNLLHNAEQEIAQLQQRLNNQEYSPAEVSGIYHSVEVEETLPVSVAMQSHWRVTPQTMLEVSIDAAGRPDTPSSETFFMCRNLVALLEASEQRTRPVEQALEMARSSLIQSALREDYEPPDSNLEFVFDVVVQQANA